MAITTVTILGDPVRTFECASTNRYTSDTNGLFTGVTVADAKDFIAAGYVILAPQSPASAIFQFGGAAFGSALGSFNAEGNLYRNVGNPIAGNAADTTDDIISGIVLPAGSFDVAGRGLCITAQGKLGATANNKRIKIWANPTMAGQTVTSGVISGGTVSGVGSGVLLMDSQVQTGNAVGWQMVLNWFKYGAAGANTQFSQGSPIFGTTHGGIGVPVLSTLAENAAINLVFTGSSPTTGAANDVVLNLIEINALN